MPYHAVRVDLIIEAENDAEVADAVSAILSEQMKKYVPTSALIDWRYNDGFAAGLPVEITLPDDYHPDDSPWPIAD